MRIDSHHHLWNYSVEEYAWIGPEMTQLRRDFSAHDLQTEIAACAIDGVITVQARQSLEETLWLLEIAAEYDFIKGVVGWLPLADANVERDLERFSHYAALKSIRHVVQDEPDDEFILREDFNRGVELLKDYGFVYDILVFGRQLGNTIRFVDRHPEQAFVLDHIAKPTIRRDEFDQVWAEALHELAKRPNVSCKFSALVTEVRDEQWDVSTLLPYWEVALEAFSPQRLMFGSDWPVCLLRSTYATWVAAVRELTDPLTPTEQAAVWGRTAMQAYRLEP